MSAEKWSTTHSDTWEVNRRDTIGTVEHHAVCDAKGKIVAFAVDYSDEPFAELCTDHVALITAAPDMLEVLQDLAEIRDALMNDRDPSMTTEEWEAKWFAAMAKATGGAA